jgi:integrase
LGVFISNRLRHHHDPRRRHEVGRKEERTVASIDPLRRDPVTGRPARDTRWKARYRDPQGRQRTKTFDRKHDAERFVSAVTTDMGRGDWIDPRRSRVTFSEWADAWWATTVHLRASTRKGYATALNARVRPRFDRMPIGSIDRTVVKEFIAELAARGLASKTIANTALVLRLVLQEAVEGGALKDNPASNLKLPTARRQEPRFLTAEEVGRLVAATRDPFGFLILFAAYTGLRPSELCGLRVGRLDLLRGRVEVAETLMQVEGKTVIGPTKSDSVRTVPLPAFLRDEAGEYLAFRRAQLGRPLAPQDLVFAPITSKHGATRTDYLYAESIRRYILKPALAASGLPEDVRTHDLRHTCASLLISLGAHPRAIMERLGHSDITVTLNVYGHLFPSLEEQLTDGLDELYRNAAATPTRGGKSIGTLR